MSLLKEDKRVNQISKYKEKAKQFIKDLNNKSLKDCLGIPKKLERNESVKKGWIHGKCVFKSGSGDRITEKRICKCFYYRNRCRKNSMCQKDNCKIKFFKKEYKLNNCDVLDYEIPINYVTRKIGEFDLLIKYGNDSYAVEVKPPNSKETILRMILEILTYDFCNCYNKDNPDDYNHNKERAIIKNNKADDNDKMKSGIYYELGIAFFAGSKQHHQFEECKNNQDVIKILKKYNISVFIINKDENKSGYKIEKQNLY
jgi:hypothetical protein